MKTKCLKCDKIIREQNLHQHLTKDCGHIKYKQRDTLGRDIL